MDRVLRIGLAGVVIALSGCANWNAVTKDFTTKDGKAVSIDAKQRAVYSVQVFDRYGNFKDGVCAEPSPDAMSALAASLGLDAGTAAKTLGLAFSSQEAAASIGLRTQTIQTLRDAMYRLCEGYAGGALDDVGFVRLQRRYQAVMLGLLAIEQLTGATVANQAALSSSGGARLGASLGKVSAMVTDARQKLVEAQSEMAARKAAVAAKTKEVSDAEAALKKASDEAKGQETDVLKDARDKHKARNEELAALQAALAKTQQNVAVASGDLESLEQLRKDLDRASAIGAASAQLGGTSTAASGPADQSAAALVAKAVENIVTTIVQHDYSKEACMDWMLSGSMRDGFSSRDARQVSLAQVQFEICREERLMTHQVQLEKAKAAMAFAAAQAATPAAAAQPAEPPKPRAPADKKQPAPAPAAQPAPAVPAPPAAPASAAMPAPPASSITSLYSETGKRINTILETAKSEPVVEPKPRGARTQAEK